MGRILCYICVDFLGSLWQARYAFQKRTKNVGLFDENHTVRFRIWRFFAVRLPSFGLAGAGWALQRRLGIGSGGGHFPFHFWATLCRASSKNVKIVQLFHENSVAGFGFSGLVLRFRVYFRFRTSFRPRVCVS